MTPPPFVPHPCRMLEGDLDVEDAYKSSLPSPPSSASSSSTLTSSSQKSAASKSVLTAPVPLSSSSLKNSASSKSENNLLLVSYTPGEHVFQAGWMCKQSPGVIMGAWPKRYFVLCKKAIFYWKSDTEFQLSKKPRGFIVLVSCIIEVLGVVEGKSDKKYQGQSFVFAISPRSQEKVFFMSTDSEAEREDWVTKIRLQKALLSRPSVITPQSRTTSSALPSSSSSSLSSSTPLAAVANTSDEIRDSSLDLTCCRCDAVFTFTNRRHRCRRCNLTVCNTCSQQRARLPELAMNDLQRVCNFCFRELNTALLEDDERSEPSSPRPSPFLEKIEHLGTVRTKVVPARRRSSISAPSAPENFQIIDEYGPGQHDNVKSEHSVPTEVGRTVVSGNAHEPDDKLHDEYNYEKFIHETNADKSFNGEQQRLCEMEQREGDGGSGSKSDDYHIPDYLEESETFENIDSLYKKLGINRNDLTLSSTPKRTQLVKDKQEPYMTMSRDNAASASNRTQQGDSSCCCTSCCSCCCSCCSAEVEEDEQYQALN